MVDAGNIFYRQLDPISVNVNGD